FERFDARRKLIVGSVDGQRDLLHPSLDALTESARGREPDVTRGGRKEDEPHQIGAGLERRIERLRRVEAAELEQKRHAKAHYNKDSRTFPIIVRPLGPGS